MKILFSSYLCLFFYFKKPSKTLKDLVALSNLLKLYSRIGFVSSTYPINLAQSNVHILLNESIEIHINSPTINANNDLRIVLGYIQILGLFSLAFLENLRYTYNQNISLRILMGLIFLTQHPKKRRGVQTRNKRAKTGGGFRGGKKKKRQYVTRVFLSLSFSFSFL